MERRLDVLRAGYTTNRHTQQTSTNCHTQAPRCLASIQHKLADFKLIIMSATLQGGPGFTLHVKDEGESVYWNGKSYCWGVSARKLTQHWIHWCIMMHYDALMHNWSAAGTSRTVSRVWKQTLETWTKTLQFCYLLLLFLLFAQASSHLAGTAVTNAAIWWKLIRPNSSMSLPVASHEEECCSRCGRLVLSGKTEAWLQSIYQA